MLIITRREGEGIVIGDDIVVMVALADKGGVRLGISAPPETLILREELLELEP